MQCLSPAVRGKNRCRMHGGSAGSGAPKGERNGAYRTGLHTAETVAFRRECRSVISASADGLAAILGQMRGES
ncbi:HGGxSTG domain-containing protein [Methylobacterium sp. J-072]|uniref:HGGxSTG domain-containing protein n=1 Tax=Methylobacterium sp. J-072 TaxID=2836651 RepID=UPI0024441F61|nr:HGGxSTG domain-containing protein [Methylobacterium sp. J-072]